MHLFKADLLFVSGNNTFVRNKALVDGGAI